MGQFQAIHGTGHMDVGEQDMNVVGLGGQDSKRILGVPCFNDGEPCLSQRINGHHPYQRLVLCHDNDQGHGVSFGYRGHRPKMPVVPGSCRLQTQCQRRY